MEVNNIKHKFQNKIKDDILAVDQKFLSYDKTNKNVRPSIF